MKVEIFNRTTKKYLTMDEFMHKSNDNEIEILESLITSNPPTHKITVCNSTYTYPLYTYAVKDHKGNKLPVRDIRHNHLSDTHREITLHLKDTFDILSASINEICTRLDIEMDYQAGVLYLHDFRNNYRLRQLLNIEEEINNEELDRFIYRTPNINEDYRYLNLHWLKRYVKNKREE